MDRRTFVVGALAGLGISTPAAAQQAGKVYRVGYLDQGAAARNSVYVEAFRQGLQDLGWAEGRLTIHVRFADGKRDQLRRLASELVWLKMDVIVTSGTPAALAARHASPTTPIVMGLAADPVGSGIVSSLAHPGGNITGWTHLALDRAEYLELLKEAVPQATRFGVVWNRSHQAHQPSLKIIEAAGQKLNVEVYVIAVQDREELEGTFSALVENSVQALIVLPDGMLLAHGALILSLAARTRLPAIYGLREYAEAGGLMAYGPDLSHMHRLGASFVDKILRGASPGSLPVAQPTALKLVVNLKTAEALGLTIPPSLLTRADPVIR
jgi:putative ABC transport system substrate-binding protein